MCAHLRPKSRRIAAVGLRNTSLRLGVRGDQPGYSNVRAVLRNFVPYKGLHPLRRYAAIPADFAIDAIC